MSVKWSLIFGILLALVIGASAAPRFVPPDDTRPLLRRDLLPLDPSAMKSLADQLAVMADGPALPFPADLQRRARTLALCLRVSPAHPTGRRILNTLRNGKNRSAPSKEKLDQAKQALLAEAIWLIKRPASDEGHRLAKLLLDVLQPGSPNHPLMTARIPEQQDERWAGVIADLRVFANKPKTAPVVTIVPDRPKPTPVKPKADPYKTKALLTKFPIFSKPNSKGGSKIPKSTLVDLSLIITPNTKVDSPFNWKPATKTPRLSLANRIRRAMTSLGTPLPAGFTQHVSSDRSPYHSSNANNIAAPVAMMLDAALTGRPLRRNTILLAELRPDGSFAKSARTWELLLFLDQITAPAGSRLIVSPGLEEELTALLVMEKASFFTRYEVISAPNLKSARELYSEDGKPAEGLTFAIAGYQEVREKAFEANSLATFLSLSSVEARLLKAQKSSAAHLSVAMLATQAVRRPAYLSRIMLARELHRRLTPLSHVTYEFNVTTLRSIRDHYKVTRSALNPLSRRVRMQEEELLREALDVIKELNSFSREADTPIERRGAFLAFQGKLTAFRQRLLQTSGDLPKK